MLRPPVVSHPVRLTVNCNKKVVRNGQQHCTRVVWSNAHTHTSLLSTNIIMHVAFFFFSHATFLFSEKIMVKPKTYKNNCVRKCFQALKFFVVNNYSQSMF